MASFQQGVSSRDQLVEETAAQSEEMRKAMKRLGISPDDWAAWAEERAAEKEGIEKEIGSKEAELKELKEEFSRLETARGSGRHTGNPAGAAEKVNRIMAALENDGALAVELRR